MAAPTAAPTTVGVAIFTCPVGSTAIVKALTVCNTSAAAASYAFGIGGVGSGQRLIGVTPLAAGTSALILPELVLLPGQQLYAASTVNGALTVSAHGALLLGVNPL